MLIYSWQHSKYYAIKQRLYMPLCWLKSLADNNQSRDVVHKVKREFLSILFSFTSSVVCPNIYFVLVCETSVVFSGFIFSLLLVLTLGK
jgi:hypothetical protein